MATTLVQVRIDDELKNQATAVYDALGIDLSTAVRMFLKRSVMVNGVPFNMTLPKNDYKAERAARDLQELSNAAMENGTSEMSLEEINAEIEAESSKNLSTISLVRSLIMRTISRLLISSTSFLNFVPLLYSLFFFLSIGRIHKFGIKYFFIFVQFFA